MAKVAADTDLITRCFQKWIDKVLLKSGSESKCAALNDSLKAASEDILKTLKVLPLAFHLLTVSPVSKLREIAITLYNKYPVELRFIVSNAIKITNLRSDCNVELTNMLSEEERRFNTSKNRQLSDRNEAIDSEEYATDLLVRVFQSTTESTSSSSSSLSQSTSLHALSSLASPFKGFGLSHASSHFALGSTTPSKNPMSLKALRELAADVAGPSAKARQESLEASMDRAIGLGSNSVSRKSSESECVGIATEDISPEDLCYISISDIRVKGLMSGSILGMCNPYLVLTLGATRIKTKVLWNKKAEAEWTDVLVFRASKSSLASSRLKIQVYDKERIRRKKLIGEVAIKLTGLDMHSIDSWFAMNTKEGLPGCDAHLTMTSSSIETQTTPKK